jgi:hypothetical protein
LASEGLDELGTKEAMGEDLDFVLSSGGSNKRKALPNEKKKMKKNIHN